MQHTHSARRWSSIRLRPTRKGGPWNAFCDPFRVVKWKMLDDHTNIKADTMMRLAGQTECFRNAKLTLEKIYLP